MDEYRVTLYGGHVMTVQLDSETAKTYRAAKVEKVEPVETKAKAPANKAAAKPLNK